MIALILDSCTAPVDPWPGTYVGTLTSSARDCTTGASLGPPESASDTITIERGAAGLFVAGAHCTYTLEELSARSSSVEPSACETTLPDGTPAHVEIVSGGATLEGSQLSLTIAIDVATATECVTSSASFVGVRR